MADFFVSSTGSNTSPYDTWAKAANDLAGFNACLAAATATGDRIIIDKANVPSELSALAADTTFTFAGNVHLISGTQNGAAGFTYTPMGMDTWIGHSSSNRSVVFTGAFRASLHGITLRVSGTTADSIALNAADGGDFTAIDCTFWINNPGAGAVIIFNGTAIGGEYRTTLINPVFRFGSASINRIASRIGQLVIIGGSVSSLGVIPTTLIENNTGRSNITIIGMDLSNVNTTLFGSGINGGFIAHLDRCRLASGVTILPSQSSISRGAGQVYITDCSSADQHFHYGYYDVFGSLTCTSSIYANDGAAYDSGGNKHSWVVATNSNVNSAGPFIAPLLSRYFEEGSITPYIEILRTGTTTKYTNAEVWAEWHAKTTSGSTRASYSTNRATIGTTPSDLPDGIGTNNWTYGGGNAVSMRLQPPSQLSIAEIGAVSAQICCAVPSTTFYIDPQIRT